jgi:hypothetical protein
MRHVARGACSWLHIRDGQRTAGSFQAGTARVVCHSHCTANTQPLANQHILHRHARFSTLIGVASLWFPVSIAPSFPWHSQSRHCTLTCIITPSSTAVGGTLGPASRDAAQWLQQQHGNSCTHTAILHWLSTVHRLSTLPSAVISGASAWHSQMMVHTTQ